MKFAIERITIENSKQVYLDNVFTFHNMSETQNISST